MKMRSRSGPETRPAAGDREQGHGGMPESATFTAPIRKKWKRNVKGETPLHRACIRGDAQQAFTLIQQGHPLCERDNAGWTPLHEACNYGWLEIVRLLLSKGASPNNEEDRQCGGITVLHDALANGWLSVAQLLIDNGASLTARDSEGRTPADSLNNWVKKLKEPDPKVMQQCEGMLAQLKSHGNMVSEMTICITDVRSLVPNEAKASSLASSPPCQRPSRNSRPPQRPSTSAARRSRSRSGQRDGEESEGEDGYPRVWAVECTWSPESVLDETPGPSGVVSQEEPGQERSALTVLGRQDPVGILDGEWLEVERTQEAGSSHELDQSRPPREQTALDPSPSRFPSPPADTPMDEGSRSPTEAPIQTPSLPPPLRVRVCVLDKVFLIPVPHSPFASPTVSWLATEAAGRSALVWGYRPQLSLSSHRALLAPDDLLTHTLRDNEQVEAEVLSWDIPPIATRYKTACQSLCLDEDAAMVKILELQQGASSMDLSGLRLGTERLVPLLRSLRLHMATRELRLAAMQLALPALGELLTTLLTLPNLTLLDLSDNLINGPGLSELSEGARRSAQTPFPSLRELNLSLNPLGEGSWQSLAVLLECCPLLATLRLRGCDLTAAVLQHPVLSCALQGCCVKTLELSGNPLGCLGLHPLARTLRHLDLTHLQLDSITTLPRDGNLTEPLLTYLGQGNNALTHLSLANNDLNDSSVQQLASCIPSLTSLAFLDLSQNPGIGSPGLQLLLEALEKRDSCLQVLDLSGCSVNQQDSKQGTLRWYLRELRL